MDYDGILWLDTRQAAARLAVPPRELYRLVDQGELPAYKKERDLRLRAGDVDNYRAAHASGS